MLNKGRENVAVRIAKMLGDEIGEANPRDPASWLVVAKRRGCRVLSYSWQDGPSGYYMPSPVEGECLIEYNIAYPDEKQAGTLCRAMSHHITHFLYPLTSFEPINLDDGKRDPLRQPGGDQRTV